MIIPKSLTTVTPFSKFLAMGLFLLLPFAGFYLGMRYQETLDSAKKQRSTTQAIPRKPLSLVDETANWKTYRNKEYGLEIKYPNNLSVSFSVYNGVVLEDTDSPNNGRFLIKLVNQKFEEAIKNIASKEVKDTQINQRNTVYYSLGEHNQLNQYYKIKANANQILEVQIILTENGSLSFEKQSKIFDQILSTFRFTQ